MLGTPHERFQDRFVLLLGEARALAHHMSESMGARFADGVPGDAFPEATVQRLLLALFPLYHAAVGVLDDPETTLASLALMRGLIEAWAHLYFLMGTDKGADCACRAIRLELGWSASMVSLARAAGPDMRDQLEVAERRLAEIDAMKSQRGCKGGRRDYGDVDQTITTMARLYGIDWLPGAWRSASQMAHVGGWDWLLEDQGDGTSAFVYPPPSHRATRLNHLVVLFYNVVQTALVVIGVNFESDAATDPHVRAMRILDDRFLARAIDGDYD